MKSRPWVTHGSWAKGTPAPHGRPRRPAFLLPLPLLPSASRLLPLRCSSQDRPSSSASPHPTRFSKVHVNPPPGSLCHSTPPHGPCTPRVPDSGTISGERHPWLDRAWWEGCGSSLPFSGSPGSARHPVTLRGAADGAGVWSPRGLILRTQSLALGLCLVLPV